jgi:hypothetical protein
LDLDGVAKRVKTPLKSINKVLALITYVTAKLAMLTQVMGTASRLPREMILAARFQEGLRTLKIFNLET